MEATLEETLVVRKTRELCQTILEQPEFSLIRESMDSFMASDEAKNQYQIVMEKGESLQQKQQTGLPLDNDEIAEFEKNRELLMANPVACGFLDAQQKMHKTQETVMKFVSKTFELGRVPTQEDFQEGSCGTGCGCH